MKRVLITGSNSYIGKHIEALLESFSGQYKVDAISLRDAAWRSHDFSPYDVIIHVAGIAHARETKENAHLYYEVNEHLTVAAAEKAKKSGVRQFILLSTMSVYGKLCGHIDKNTVPAPTTHYGISKLNADMKIMEMASEDFKVAVLRPPMVYGKDCRGNYQLLRKLALMTPVFPGYMNERSMIFIDNLAEFVKDVMDLEKEGVFHPQDREYISTCNMVHAIAEKNNKKMHFTRCFNWLIIIMLKLNIPVVCKVFGNLTYEKDDVVGELDFGEAMDRVEPK